MNIIEKQATNPASTLDGSEFVYIAQVGADAVGTTQQIADLTLGQLNSFVEQGYDNPADGATINVNQLDTDIVVSINDGVERLATLELYLLQSNNYAEGAIIRIRLVTNAAIPQFVVHEFTEAILPKSNVFTVPIGADYTWVYQKRNGQIVLMSLTM